MKLALIRTDYTNTPKIIVCETKDAFGSTRQLAVGIITESRSDFNLNNPFIIADETDSVQYRPKLLYQNKSGEIYYKHKKYKVLLNMQEKSYVEAFKIAAKVYLEGLKPKVKRDNCI